MAEDQKLVVDVKAIVKEYFPSASNGEAISVLWECTGYPHFWNIPADGATPEQCLRKQLLEATNKNNCDVNKALLIAEQELEEQMKKYEDEE